MTAFILYWWNYHYAHWRAAASYSLPGIIPIKDKHKGQQLARYQVIILTLMPWPAISLIWTFYRFLGHCQWSCCLVWPMVVITIPCLRLPTLGEEFWQFLAVYSKSKSTLHISVHIQVAIQVPLKALLILFGVPHQFHIISSDSFYFPKYTMLSSWTRHSTELSLALLASGRRPPKHNNDLFKQVLTQLNKI